MIVDESNSSGSGGWPFSIISGDEYLHIAYHRHDGMWKSYYSNNKDNSFSNNAVLLSSSNWSVETPTIAIDNYGRVHGIYRKRTLNTDPPPDIYYFRSNNVIDKGPKIIT